MQNLSLLLIIALLTINIFAFTFVAVDKNKSVSHSQRLPEVYFFFLATLFGSLGVFLGMLAFRHKTRKFYFMLGIALLLIEQALLVAALIKISSHS